MERYIFQIEQGNPVLVVVTMDKPDPAKFKGGILNHYYCLDKKRYDAGFNNSKRLTVISPPPHWKLGMEVKESEFRKHKQQKHIKDGKENWSDAPDDIYNVLHDTFKRIVAIPIVSSTEQNNEPVYNQNCGLSIEEWEAEKIVDKIRQAPTLEAIGILLKYKKNHHQ